MIIGIPKIGVFKSFLIKFSKGVITRHNMPMKMRTRFSIYKWRILLFWVVCPIHHIRNIEVRDLKSLLQSWQEILDNLAIFPRLLFSHLFISSKMSCWNNKRTPQMSLIKCQNNFLMLCKCYCCRIFIIWRTVSTQFISFLLYCNIFIKKNFNLPRDVISPSFSINSKKSNTQISPWQGTLTIQKQKKIKQNLKEYSTSLIANAMWFILLIKNCSNLRNFYTENATLFFEFSPIKSSELVHPPPDN